MFLKIIFSIIFISILGVAKSQVSFFTSVDLHTKMSFNSNNFSYWETNRINFSNEFLYKNANYTLWDPFRLGASIGVKFKSGNELMSSIQYDGVTSSARIVFLDPDLSVNADPNTIDIVAQGQGMLGRFRSSQYKFSMLYYFSLIHKEKSTTFAVSPIFSLVWRAGPLGVGSAGSVGFSGQLLPNNKIFEYNTTGYTAYGKYALVYGLAVKSDLYRKNKYLFSIGLQFTPSKRYLSFFKTSIKVIDNTNKATNYIFYQYNKASGLYFTVSRRFQIYPWKKRKNKD